MTSTQNFSAACDPSGRCHAARSFHAPCARNIAISAKNNPVTCSHTTLENRATGVHTDFPSLPA